MACDYIDAIIQIVAHSIHYFRIDSMLMDLAFPDLEMSIMV